MTVPMGKISYFRGSFWDERRENFFLFARFERIILRSLQVAAGILLGGVATALIYFL